MLANINHIDHLLRSGEAYVDYKKKGISDLAMTRQQTITC